MNHPIVLILGIPFWNGETDELLRQADRTGGSVTVPSAPSLAQADRDPPLLLAYQKSTYAVVDGGYFALILKWILGRPMRRISGLQIIQRLFVDEEPPLPIRERRLLWVVPHDTERDRIAALLAASGFDASRQSYYNAPFYRSEADFHDPVLLERVRETAADWVIVCIGGGRQEKLAYWLQQDTADWERPPVALCTGAAIAFFTGGQARIPAWADRLFLGWFFRILENPKLYGKRYGDAFYRLPLMILRRRREIFIDSRSAPSS